MLEIAGSTARFAVECGSGTYIRALAHQMGIDLGCGAHMAAITRTAVGEFTLDRAVSLAELEEATRAGKAVDLIVPLNRLLPDLPSVTVEPMIEQRVRHGSKFQITLAQIQPGRVETPPGAPFKLDSGEWKPARLRVFNQQQELIAIAEGIVPRTYQPVLVLAAQD